MPANVVWFERLMIGSIMAGLIGNFLLWQRVGTASTAEFAVAATVMIANFGLMLLLIWLIARRQIGWLRYVFGGVFVLGAWHAILELPAEFGAYPTDGLLSLARQCAVPHFYRRCAGLVRQARFAKMNEPACKRVAMKPAGLACASVQSGG
jgi:hypothetical protein